MSQTIYLLDRLISKHIKVTNAKYVEQLKPGDKIIYIQDGETVQKLGIFVGFEVPTEITGTFVEHLAGQKELQFRANQQKALNMFASFQKEFTLEFKEAIPVTARMNLQGTTAYFFFYSEQRFQFSDFVKRFREKIGMNFFLYQVGARDMIRLSPNAKEWLAGCGCWPLGCHSLWVLPSIEMENVALQNLEWRDIEKLKGRCGKLKCSLIYERETYLQELKEYPKKWESLIFNGKECVCINTNIISHTILLRSTDGENLHLHLNDYKKNKNI